jgi:hypothetical protein
MPILGIMASQISGHLWAPEGAYDSLATVTVGATAVSSIEFAGIPAGYKHLQIRAIYRTNAAFAGTLDMWMRFNSDTGSNYSRHVVAGNGATATAGANLTQTRIPFGNAIPGASSTANTFGAAVIDILDYASTNKNKTVRGLYGLTTIQPIPNIALNLTLVFGMQHQQQLLQ